MPVGMIEIAGVIDWTSPVKPSGLQVDGSSCVPGTRIVSKAMSALEGVVDPGLIEDGRRGGVDEVSC